MKKQLLQSIFVLLLIPGSFACQPLLDGNKQLSTSKANELLARGRVIHRQKQSLSQELSLTATNSKVFQLHLDPLNGELRWLLFDVELKDDISGSELASYAHQWLKEYETDYKLPAYESFTHKKPTQRKLSDDMISLSFPQYIDGIEVKDAFIDFIFVRQQNDLWRLRELVNQTSAYPQDLTSNLLSFQELLDILNWQDAEYVDSKLLWRIDAVQGRLVQAQEFTLSRQGESFSWLIDTDSKEIVDGYRHNLAIRGQISAEVYSRSYADDEMVMQPMSLTRVQGDGLNLISTSDGLINANVSPTHVILEGPRARVYQQDDELPESVELIASDDGSYILDSTGKMAAVNAYIATQRINRFVRTFLSSSEVSYLDKPLEIRVNVKGECNAYYTTGIARITLYGQGGQCANLALINDVVYHEWGHGLNEYTGRKFGVADGAFSEGISDLTSALYTGDPEIGRGFVIGSLAGIRSVKNFRSYPKDVGDVHREGGIIANAFWELREEFELRYGRTAGQYRAADLFFRHLLTADTYHDSYQSVLRLDDDDGNPATRSPNFCLINRIFAERGLAEAEHCEDKTQVPYQKTGVDRDLFLAFSEPVEGQIGLVASSAYADRLSVCFGDRSACLSQGRTHFHFSSVRSEGSTRRFFVLDDHLPLKGLDLVTIIAKNSRGQIIGSRVVKLVQK